MSECLYIVYHNISLSNSEVAIDLKGVEESFFKEQLEALCRNYEPISLEMMSESVKSGIALPSKCFCMTFDDGYKEHISIAADYLSRNNVTGSFYINTQKLEAKKLITVDKQRFLQYGTGSFNGFLVSFCGAIKNLFPDIYDDRYEPTLENISTASTFYNEFEFYSNEERFYRKIRDVYLNEQQVKDVVDFLFSGYFESEAAMVDQYFMDWDELRELKGIGMEIGGHSHSHPLLSRLSYDEQYFDISKNIRLLKDNLGVNVKGFTYPYGAFNGNTIKVLKNNNIEFGFMEDGMIDRSDLKDTYQLSRIGPEKVAEILAEK